MSYIELENYDLVLENIRQNFTVFCSFVYEEVALEVLQYHIKNGAIKEKFAHFGRWWSKETEIDLVAMDMDGRHILVGECKWTNQPVSYRVLKRLKSKALLLKKSIPDKNPKITYALFSKSGFAGDLISKKSKELLLFDRDRLM